MEKNKSDIIANLCYTELVYGRINKKLKSNKSNKEIEVYLLNILKNTPLSGYIKTGKNFYVSSFENNIRITVNSYTYRVITVDKLD
ncbi:hypothetical protein FFWV33_02035 [Flavobacterium faecale]|uniref:DUF3781 domain-containing protein n=1 Tax=Flavobacterium faecale TaxID=1355330 RepID=A0A2S1L9H9_9FLAO|nr:DUF3781 domain-containing protein [Flavobacterium faecale]AWG20391.1 hypothetical protein FFWV33_02035 [Flavobacterium faecale]